MTSHSVLLPYGRTSYALRLPGDIDASIVDPPRAEPTRPLADLLQNALEHPIDAPRLRDAVRSGDRVLIAVSDDTRDDPRDVMLRALLARMPADIRLTLAVANGTHGPSRLDRLGIGADVWQRATVVNHDAHDDRDMITIGTTRRGTPVRLHRCAVETDWLIATGRIKPHYFAGYGAGCKAIFPGLGANHEIRVNHRLKTEPGARAGVVAGNPCRQDLEEAVAMLSVRQFLLNVVLDADGGAQAAVAGHMTRAFQRGAALCERFFRVQAPRADVVIVSDELPLSGSLYQASKLVAAAAELVAAGGTIVIVAECPHGIGPVNTVNEAIYQLGLKPRLPQHHRIVLVSGLDRNQVEASYCRWAPSVEAIFESLASRASTSRVTILPRAGSLLVTPIQ